MSGVLKSNNQDNADYWFAAEANTSAIRLQNQLLLAGEVEDGNINNPQDIKGLFTAISNAVSFADISNVANDYIVIHRNSAINQHFPTQFRPTSSTISNGSVLNFVCENTNTGVSTIKINQDATAFTIKKYNNLGALVGLEAGDIRAKIPNYIYKVDADNFLLIGADLRTSLTTQATQLLATQQPIILSYVNTTTINYSAGGFVFDDYTGSGSVTAGTINLATNGIGGLDTGTIAANATYFLHSYKNNTTGVFGVAMSTSPTTSTIAGWARVARIRGAVLITNASSQIIQGTWFSDGTFLFTQTITSVANATQSVNTETLRTIASPFGIVVDAFVALKVYNNTVATAGEIRFRHYSPFIVTPTINSDSYTALVIYDASSGLVLCNSDFVPIRTNTSSQIKTNALRISGSNNATFYLTVEGWADNMN